MSNLAALFALYPRFDDAVKSAYANSEYRF